jgi:hypothetical protein
MLARYSQRDGGSDDERRVLAVFAGHCCCWQRIHYVRLRCSFLKRPLTRTVYACTAVRRVRPVRRKRRWARRRARRARRDAQRVVTVRVTLSGVMCHVRRDVFSRRQHQLHRLHGRSLLERASVADVRAVRRRTLCGGIQCDNSEYTRVDDRLSCSDVVRGRSVRRVVWARRPTTSPARACAGRARLGHMRARPHCRRCVLCWRVCWPLTRTLRHTQCTPCAPGSANNASMLTMPCVVCSAGQEAPLEGQEYVRADHTVCVC